LVAGAGIALLAPRVRAGASALSDAARAALATSPLVYVSPLKRDGSECHCHSEVWFAAEGEGAFVVTSAKAWRARAVGKGLGRARLWVGDRGTWDPSLERRPFSDLPSFVAEANVESAPAVHERALVLFGSKYASEWGSWGPRFKNGLADGTRVLLHYRAVSG
jgi:hypothetical protein